LKISFIFIITPSRTHRWISGDISSSSLKLQKAKADLSRRLVYYEMKGLSFREYLELKDGTRFPPLTLKKILRSHVRYAQEISAGFAVLKSFRQYLTSGYYPFFVEGEGVYLQ